MTSTHWAWVLVVLVSLAGCRKARLPEVPVNTQLTRMEDVTGDGKPETITLFIKAGSYKAPVQWLLTIDSGGRTIFDADGDDTEVDGLFDDREAMPGCPDYPTCKNEYYFHSILDNLITRTYDVDEVLDMTTPGGTLNPVARAYLARCCSLSTAAVERAAKDLEQRLREKKAILISAPISPVATGPRMVYAPEADQFVPIDPE